MIKKLKVLALIPARGGSKRLKNKNILLLRGKPLIAHSIRDAKESKYIDRVIVSTDSLKIASAAKKYGAEVPFSRPKNIARDKISDYPVIAHAVKFMEEKHSFSADIIVLLRPTTPLRKKGLIDRCIEKLVQTKADSVRTVRPVGRFHPYWMLRLDKKGLAHSLIKGKTIDRYYQKQLLPEFYEHDGYCDLLKRQNIDSNCSPKRKLNGLYGKKMAAVINNDNKLLINIDTIDDFRLAECVMRRKH